MNSMHPIATFQTAAQHPYDAPRQPGAGASAHGAVVLHPGHNYEQALRDLDGVERIWLIYLFHHNRNWKPCVMPPRATRKVGVFATRAPYRPNPIGLSCVRLLKVDGLRIEVGEHDLLDGTPILDIKPYVPYADAFPDSFVAWLDAVPTDNWTVVFTDTASERVAWLEERGAGPIRDFAQNQLQEKPFDTARKRIRESSPGMWTLAYRTWRMDIAADPDERCLTVVRVYSAYTTADLADPHDAHGDKPLHDCFNKKFRTK